MAFQSANLRRSLRRAMMEFYLFARWSVSLLPSEWGTRHEQEAQLWHCSILPSQIAVACRLWCWHCSGYESVGIAWSGASAVALATGLMCCSGCCRLLTLQLALLGEPVSCWHRLGIWSVTTCGMPHAVDQAAPCSHPASIRPASVTWLLLCCLKANSSNCSLV